MAYPLLPRFDAPLDFSGNPRRFIRDHRTVLEEYGAMVVTPIQLPGIGWSHLKPETMKLSRIETHDYVCNRGIVEVKPRWSEKEDNGVLSEWLQAEGSRKEWEARREGKFRTSNEEICEELDEVLAALEGKGRFTRRYCADMPQTLPHHLQGSLPLDLRSEAVGWPAALRRKRAAIPGVTTPMQYCGATGTLAAAHIEDLGLMSINQMILGACKVWIVIPLHAVERYEQLLLKKFKRDVSEEANECTRYHRHKEAFITPRRLREEGVDFNCIFQQPGDVVVTSRRGYHSIVNLGPNLAEAVNLMDRDWVSNLSRLDLCGRRCSKTSELRAMAQSLADHLGIRIPMEDDPACFLHVLGSVGDITIRPSSQSFPASAEASETPGEDTLGRDVVTAPEDSSDLAPGGPFEGSDQWSGDMSEDLISRIREITLGGNPYGLYYPAV